MQYYKIVQNNKIVGVGTSMDLRRWMPSQNVLIAVDESSAELIQGLFDDLYHDDWMLPCTSPLEYQQAEVTLITETEYRELYETISGDVTPDDDPGPDPEPGDDDPEDEQADPEPPMSIQEMRAKISEQEKKISMLTDCILEMSEIVYEG